MINSRIPLLFAGFALVCSAASADEFTYDYVRLDYVSSDLDIGLFDVDGDGLHLGGSLELTEQFHAFADYQTIGFDFDVDRNAFEVGGGFHTGLAPQTDFVGTVSYVFAEVETPFGDVDDDGFGLSAGLRHMLNPNFELHGALKYYNLSDSSTSLEFRGDYYLTERVAVGGGLQIGDDETTWMIGGRYDFDGFR